MKELKIILLVVALGFGSTVPATTKFPNAFYPNTIKGGIQTSHKHESAAVADIGVEGNYEYYMQYIKYQLNYKKNEDDGGSKKAMVSPACVLAEKEKASC